MTMPKAHLAFTEHSIVPDVLSKLPLKAQVLGVGYGERELSPGEIFARKFTLDKPEIRFNGAQPGREYVLIMVCVTP
jgi:hypothetical protein